MGNTDAQPEAYATGSNAERHDDNNAMASSMKTMNTVMPLMSAFFCFTFPMGLGIYWIAKFSSKKYPAASDQPSSGQDEYRRSVNENMKKMEAKRAKEGLPPQKITNQAHQSARNINKIDKGMSGTDEKAAVRKK